MKKQDLQKIIREEIQKVLEADNPCGCGELNEMPKKRIKGSTGKKSPFQSAANEIMADIKARQGLERTNYYLRAAILPYMKTLNKFMEDDDTDAQIVANATRKPIKKVVAAINAAAKKYGIVK